MNNSDLRRRSFLKRVGLSARSLPAAVAVRKLGNTELVASPSEYGRFLARRWPKDKVPYQITESRLQRFDQRNEVFARGDWDPTVIDSEEPFDFSNGAGILRWPVNHPRCHLVWA